ncbi:hypothetical protein F0562_029407 [Nyssa sinensis]|uniref:Uncharacterized protein n=1 Tax=Nyssa sinensis TaxID=561372 RepID=A0A5J5B2N0_9ASTE|nr:hypothetical protein F0562_029407 [Nyssa sinensis]
MASFEKILTDLKLAESKKDNLRKAFEHSIFLFTLQGKDLEECFDSTRKLIEQGLEDLKSKEKEYDSVGLSKQERSKELESIEKSTKEHLKELRSKERQFDSTRLLNEERSKELDSIQELINEGFKKLQSKKMEFDSSVRFSATQCDHRRLTFFPSNIRKRIQKLYPHLDIFRVDDVEVENSLPNSSSPQTSQLRVPLLKT